MPEIVRFKAFCLEQYKYEHDMSGKAVFQLFKLYGVLDYITSFYDVLHTFGARYIVQDIDAFINMSFPIFFTRNSARLRKRLKLKGISRISA